MYDVIFIGNKTIHSKSWKEFKTRFPMLKNASNVDDAKRISITKMFWVLWPDIILEDTFDFDYLVDDWSNEYVHVFKNGNTYDGVSLIPKSANISEREFQHRFFINKKEVDLTASRPKSFDYFEIDGYDDYLHALEHSTTEMFWMSSVNINPVQELVDNFYITHHESQLRNQTHAFIHKVDDQCLYNGLFLCSKQRELSKREVEYRFPVDRIEHDIVGSGKKSYDIFEIDSYEEYLHALKNSTTEMFWMSSRNITATIPDLYFTHDNHYDRKINHNFLHCGKERNGLFLCSKHTPLGKREVDYRFLVNAKEWNIEASGPVKYDIFEIDSYDDYLEAFEISNTEMFWAVPRHVIVDSNFKFDLYFTHDNHYDRRINHVFLNGRHHDGVILCSKRLKISQREWQFKFIAGKKEHDIIASMPKPYDVVFISYQEPDADQNYNKLSKKIPNAKRIHGVKGIHQAHIEAAKLCNTPMFWIIDGDAQIIDDFNFDYQVPAWQYNHVHVWRSKNPINGLIYGYGGVKLFPTQLTIDMDVTKPDMTTSISDKFVAIKEVSNITGFNTGKFETWKSAFRECTKLASKIIDRQKDDETERRLKIWCSVGRDKPFGEYAIVGARAGMAYGSANKGNIEALKKINDFDWLKEQFDGNL
jgi:hypothetical protein